MTCSSQDQTKCVKWVLVAVFSSLLFSSLASDASGQNQRECGLDCLYMAANALGFTVELDQIRRKLGSPSEIGYSLSQLCDAAQSLGLQTKMVNGDVLGLTHIASECVVILHLKSQHFVVMRNMDDRHLVAEVYDPSKERFESLELADWSGNALLISNSEIILESPQTSAFFRPSVIFTVLAAIVIGLPITFLFLRKSRLQ